MPKKQPDSNDIVTITLLDKLPENYKLVPLDLPEHAKQMIRMAMDANLSPEQLWKNLLAVL